MIVQKVTQQVVNYREFENYINKIFPQLENSYDFSDMYECMNNSEHSFYGSFWGDDRLKEFIESTKELRVNSYISLYDLINFLTTQGVFEVGKVTIEVSW